MACGDPGLSTNEKPDPDASKEEVKESDGSTKEKFEEDVNPETDFYFRGGIGNDNALENGVIRMPGFDLPLSPVLSQEAKRYMEGKLPPSGFSEKIRAQCPIALNKATPEQLPDLRRCRAEVFRQTNTFQEVKKRYPVDVEAQIIGGIYTDVYTPKSGVPERNRERVLLHLHGGNFMLGAYWVGELAARPIASLGKYKVISVDYRQFPEATHPAAIDDTIAVYKALLATYPAENIGVYGCSAGGGLAKQAVIWADKEGLPMFGGVGIFGAGATMAYDSSFIGSAMLGVTPVVDAMDWLVNDEPYKHGYFKGSVFSRDVMPTESDHSIYARFPPSLLISSSRDYNFSGTINAHSRLIKAGIEADLHMWEGLGHCFMSKPTLPESREAHQVTVDFFDKHLGTKPKSE